MQMVNVQQVADAADMIVNGYAFSRCPEGFRVLNLNRPDRAVVFSPAAEVLETSMDDIEIQIVRGYLEKNRALLEFAKNYGLDSVVTDMTKPQVYE